MKDMQNLVLMNAKKNLEDAKDIVQKNPAEAMSLLYRAKDGFLSCTASSDSPSFRETCRQYFDETQAESWAVFKKMLKGGSDYAKNTGPIYSMPGKEENDAVWIENCILKSSEKFDTVKSMDEIKDILRAQLIYPAAGDIPFKVKSSDGILMYGPPGCGKTLLVCAAANEIGKNVKVYNVRVSDVISKWLGDSEKAIRALFKTARCGKSIIFLDEIDALARKRSLSEHEASGRFLSALLVEMDGADNKGNDNIIVVGATNRPEIIDDAILSRLSSHIYVPPPDKEAKISIIQGEINRILIGPNPVDKNIDENIIYSMMAKKEAEFSSLYSGRDIKKIVSASGHNAIIRYMRTRKDGLVTEPDFSKAVDAIIPSITKDMIDRYTQFREGHIHIIPEESKEKDLVLSLSSLTGELSKFVNTLDKKK